jgi:hypothetical protein
MVRRLKLHEVLCEVLGTRSVYYNPPESVRINYPAIVYSRKNIDNYHADNSVYGQMNAYEVTVIDGDPDSEIVGKVSRLPSCRFDRHFVSDNLNHDTFTLYF